MLYTSLIIILFVVVVAQPPGVWYREVEKKHCRGALNVIIIWQEDKSVAGEE